MLHVHCRDLDSDNVTAYEEFYKWRTHFPASFKHVRPSRPWQEAVRALGLGTTTFKRLCREAGITRWPHRKLDALARWGARADAALALGRGGAPGLDRAALAAARRALLAAAARVRADPDTSVMGPVLLARKILGPHGL
eukprot:tig00020531_g10049.t1